VCKTTGLRFEKQNITKMHLSKNDISVHRRGRVPDFADGSSRHVCQKTFPYLQFVLLQETLKESH